MAGPFGKPTGTRPKSRGSEHRDSLGSTASFLPRDLGLDLPGPPYFPSRDDAGYAAGALGEHRREMMQQPDGEEQVARNQRQGLPQYPNNQQDNQGSVRTVPQFPNNQVDSQAATRGVPQYSNNQVDGQTATRGVPQYSNNQVDGQSATRGVPQYSNNQVDGQAATRGVPQYSNNQVDGYALSHVSNRSIPSSQYPINQIDGHASGQSSNRGVPSSQYSNNQGDSRVALPSSEERRAMSLEMPNPADVSLLIRSHEAVNANLAALREKLERVQEMDVMEDGAGVRDRQARALRNQLNNLQELELEARRAHLNNSRMARNMIAKNEVRDARSEELLSEKMSLVNKLAELEERKRQMDSMLVQYNNVSELSQQFARAELEGGSGKETELRDLKARLRELQDMVTDLDRPLQPNQPEDGMENSLAMLTAQYEKTSHTEEEQQRSGNLVPPPMALLNHWSGDGEGQVNLQAEMKEKREQLEQLMRKDVLNANLNNETDQQANINKTEFFRRSMTALEQVAGRGRLDRAEMPSRSRTDQGVGRSRSKETNSDRSSWNEGRAGREDVWETGSSRRDLPGWSSRVPRDVAQNREVGRSNSGQSRGDGLVAQNTSQQLAALQVQVNKLKGDLGKLSATPALPQSTPSRNGPPVFGTGDNQQQMQQLTQSVNQVYQALWGLQREVTGLGERVRQMESSDRGDTLSVTPDEPPGGNSWDSHQENISWPGGNSLLGSAWTTPQPTLSWPQEQHLSPYPNPDLWNSLQASPGFVGGLTGLSQIPPNANNFLQSSEPDSGVSSGALNNQVSPGVRTNNYYDNFRSFSHQNRFNTTGINQARGRGQLGPAGPVDPVNNSNSTSRPRRKYKINSEQNRDQRLSGRRRHGVGAAAVAGGASSTATAASSSLAGSGIEGVATQAANDVAAVDNLTKDIYNQVGSLISQHNNVPDMLARLLEDLNMLGRGQQQPGQEVDFQPVSRNAVNNDNISILSSSSYSSEGERPPPARMLRNKTGPKRLSGGSFAVTNSALDHDSSDTVAAANNAPSHVASHAYVAAGQPGNAQWTASGAPSWPQPSVAVPKNQQKNMISRERDARKMPGWRERLLPRNMQVPQPDNDQCEFVNIQLELPGINTDTQSSRQDNAHGENLSQPHSFSDMAEAELAEADQIHEPGEPSFSMDHAIANSYPVVAVRDPDSPLRPSSGPGAHGLPLMVGLDRVPIRLPSTGSVDLDQRRSAEEETVASIVEEVLASSPELVGDGAAALPPGK